MTSRAAAERLVEVVAGIRDVAGRLDDGEGGARWAAARDLRATAFNVERIAGLLDRLGVTNGEADPAAEFIEPVGSFVGGAV